MGVANYLVATPAQRSGQPREPRLRSTPEMVKDPVILTDL
jgi:hypothetical protein